MLLSPFLPLPKPRGRAVSVKVSASTGCVVVSFVKAAAGFGAAMLVSISTVGWIGSCVSGPSDTAAWLALAWLAAISSTVELLVGPQSQLPGLETVQHLIRLGIGNK